MNWFAGMSRMVNEKRRRGKGGDNRGLTLVELVCAVAIFSLVATAAGGVLVVSARNYARGTTEAELQQAAQLAVNQIEDLIIDAVAAPGSSIHTLRIEKDGVLYEVYHDSGARQLLYREYTITPTGMLPSTEAQLLADNVDVFNVNVSQYSANGNVLLHLELSNQERSYAADFTITSRNGRNAGATSAFAASIITESELVLEPNESYTLSATVEGNLMSDAVTWTVTGNTDPATVVTPAEDGKYKIHIGTGETADTVIFTVSTQELNGSVPYAFAAVQVHVRRVKSVTITGEKSGDLYTLTADVGGPNLESMSGVPTDGATGYKDPYKIEWEYFITDYAGNILPEKDYHTYISDISQNGLETSFRAGSMDDYNLLVRATAKHPDGDNKTNTDYDDVYGEWTLKMVIQGSEWARNGKSPMFLPDLDDKYLMTDPDGKQYLTNRAEITLNWWRDGGFGEWEFLGTQGNQGGFGMMQETNLGLKVWFKEGDPRYLYATLDHNNRNFSYSTPYFAGNFDSNFGVNRLKLEMDIGGLTTAVGIFNIKDVAIQYRNSQAEDWSATSGGVQKIYVTPADNTNTYTTYFQLIDGWDKDDTNYELFNRYVGVIQDNPGFDNDKGYDLTFVTSAGTFRNEMRESGYRKFGASGADNVGLNYQTVSEKQADGRSTVSVQISQEEKDALCGMGVVVKEIYEYNPWFTNMESAYAAAGLDSLYAPPTSIEWNGDYPLSSNPNRWVITSGKQMQVERMDGCDGILEYHFVPANVELSGGAKLACMYCPDLSELGGRTCYYMNDTSRYYITGAASAAYQELRDGSWVTVYDLTKGADGIWRN